MDVDPNSIRLNNQKGRAAVKDTMLTFANLRLIFVSSSSQVGDWAECHISLLHKLPARYRFITPPDTAGPATTGIPASFAIVAQASILGRTQNRKIKTKFWKIFFMLCWGSPSLWTTNYFHNRFTTVTRRHAISNIFYVYDVLNHVCVQKWMSLVLWSWVNLSDMRWRTWILAIFEFHYAQVIYVAGAEHGEVGQ